MAKTWAEKYYVSSPTRLTMLYWTPLKIVGFVGLIELFTVEAFPTVIRAPAAGLCSAWAALNTLAAARLFPVLHTSLGLANTAWLYATLATLATIYAAIVLPENKGKILARTVQ